MSDIEDIIRGCIKQKRKSQKELYNKFSPILMGIAMRYTHDKQEAEDALQECFLIAFDKIKKLKIRTAPGLFAWMKRIMLNVIVNRFREFKKKTRLMGSITDIEEKFNDNSKQKIEGYFSKEELLNAMKQLSEKQLLIFNLRVIDGYKYHQIAKILKMSESGVKSSFKKAKVNLKKILLERKESLEKNLKEKLVKHYEKTA